MRLLHTSDWHIGRQFHNISLLDDQRVVLDQIVSIVQSSKIDVVLVAGDIYDRAIPPAKAVALLDDVLHRICCELKVPVIMIAGNHDSAARLSFGSRQLESAGLHIVGPLTDGWDPVILSDQWGDVEFYGIPYVDPVVVNDVYGTRVSTHDEAIAYLTNGIHEHRVALSQGKVKKSRAVVLSHCFIDGGDGCDSERPLSMGGADRVSPMHFEGFDYTALGHLHGRQFKGKPHIRYSGSPMQYSFSEERHTKVVTVVELLEDGATQIEDVPLHSPHKMRTIEGMLSELVLNAEMNVEKLADQKEPLDQDQGSNNDDYLLVKLMDTHAILDPMGKLRKVFPNVLHLERPALAALGRQYGVDRELLKPHEKGARKGAMSMFEDFYRQVCDSPLSEEQQKVIEVIVEECLHDKDI